MKYILSLLLALSLITPTAASDGRFADPVPTVTRYTVEDDPGGFINEFHDALKMIKDSGNGIRLNGYCASACTLLMNESLNLDVCVTKRAELRIHKPFRVRINPNNLSDYEIIRTIPVIYGAEKLWLTDFYYKYPKWLQKYIDDNGGAPSVYTGSSMSDMLVVDYDVLRQHLTTCNEGGGNGTAK